DGMRKLGTLGVWSAALDLNTLGEVTGWYSDDYGNTLKGFVWSAQSGMQPLDPQGGASYPFAINNLGEIVGYLDRPGAARAFRWSRTGGMQTLSPPGHYTDSIATDVNDAGEVVGTATPSAGSSFAYRYAEAAGIIDLNTRIDPNLGWRLDSAA